jgi:hypothetical protein
VDLPGQSTLALLVDLLVLPDRSDLVAPELLAGLLVLRDLSDLEGPAHLVDLLDQPDPLDLVLLLDPVDLSRHQLHQLLLDLALLWHRSNLVDPVGLLRLLLLSNLVGLVGLVDLRLLLLQLGLEHLWRHQLLLDLALL